MSRHTKTRTARCSSRSLPPPVRRHSENITNSEYFAFVLKTFLNKRLWSKERGPERTINAKTTEYGLQVTYRVRECGGREPAPPSSAPLAACIPTPHPTTDPSQQAFQNPEHKYRESTCADLAVREEQTRMKIVRKFTRWTTQHVQPRAFKLGPCSTFKMKLCEDCEHEIVLRTNHPDSHTLHPEPRPVVSQRTVLEKVAH